MFIKNGSYKKHTHIISYVPPTIITQPVGDIKNVGSDYTFTISAKGSRPLTYQWYKDYDPILNETSNQLILTNLLLSADGSYFCEVRNNGYLLESDIVDLTVIDSLSFSEQPESVSANSNSNVSFKVTVDSDTSVYYQWYKNSLSYPGTSDTLHINYVTENEEGTYFCVASNILAAITSNSVTLTVNDPIVIKEQPLDTTLINGDNLTLTLSCVGTFPISAQWRKNNTNYGSLSVTNTGDVNLEITNIQPTDEGNYDCVLTNIVGSVTSNKALVYINSPPTFILNPSDGISILGNSFTFNSNASGTNPISYQWIKENTGNVIGEVFKYYTLSNIQYSNSGNYACVATNLYGSVTSTFASLSVGTLPYFVVHPSSQAIAVGSDCTFNVVVTGINPISYQWYRNNNIILSAESDSYTINSVTNLNNGNYSCVASNIFGSVTSNSATLITGVAPTITVHPSSQTLYSGSNVTFSVAAIGSIPLSYQWHKNNIPILNATNNSYTINSISESNVGVYRCSVSNIFSSVISNSATLEIEYDFITAEDDIYILSELNENLISR
jgi:hypothetical protein